MEEMDWEETRSFLLDTPRTAKIATVRPDGRPHITPIWFDLDGETLIFTTWHESLKAEKGNKKQQQTYHDHLNRQPEDKRNNQPK